MKPIRESSTHPLLESHDFVIGESVSLGNDGNKVDLGVKPAHNFDVKRLERVAGWLDEVDACVDAVVNNVHAVDLVLCVEISIEALLDVLNNWTPRCIIVDKVTKARSVNDGKAQTDAILLNVRADGLDGDGLGNDVEAWWLAFLWRVQGSVEKSVHESRFAESRLACMCDQCIFLAYERIRYVPTTMTLKLKPFRTLLRCHWFGRLANPT